MVNLMFPQFHFQIERWKWNPKIGVYVSTLGNIKTRRKRSIQPLVNQSGYMCFSNGSQMYFVHRAVLSTWDPIKDCNTMTVDHLNHNKRDNRLCNLEWVSETENTNRAKRDLCAVENFDERVCVFTGDIVEVAKWLIKEAKMQESAIDYDRIVKRIQNAINQNTFYCKFAFVNDNGKISVMKKAV